MKEKLLPKGTVYDEETRTTVTRFMSLGGYDTLGIRIDSDVASEGNDWLLTIFKKNLDLSNPSDKREKKEYDLFLSFDRQINENAFQAITIFCLKYTVVDGKKKDFEITAGKDLFEKKGWEVSFITHPFARRIKAMYEKNKLEKSQIEYWDDVNSILSLNTPLSVSAK